MHIYNSCKSCHRHIHCQTYSANWIWSSVCVNTNILVIYLYVYLHNWYEIVWVFSDMRWDETSLGCVREKIESRQTSTLRLRTLLTKYQRRSLLGQYKNLLRDDKTLLVLSLPVWFLYTMHGRVSQMGPIGCPWGVSLLSSKPVFCQVSLRSGGTLRGPATTRRNGCLLHWLLGGMESAETAN